jgi:hypothetical protein
MPETDPSSGPLHFSATFPCDGRFCPAVADLSVKVALSLGYPDAEAREIGQAIHRAFEEAVGQGPGHGGVQVDVRLRPGGDAIDATVRCSQRVLLELTRPRSH